MNVKYIEIDTKKENCPVCNKTITGHGDQALDLNMYSHILKHKLLVKINNKPLKNGKGFINYKGNIKK